MSSPEKPKVLLLGDIFHAHAEWNALSAIAELHQVNDGNRERFLDDCQSGVYDGVFAISRTFDSVQVRCVLPTSLHNHAATDRLSQATDTIMPMRTAHRTV
ncbi:MAG: hypothetical protein Q9167_007021 [Letrouitia subvulpina]